ncbi:unnamed protein product [Citrullus colocynthis]|uniref:Uncharacterized protein n=1 Tax=Citrullus colocynthis TaxID=252529 RepID=A0ABP0Y118_9ROSI
MGVFRNHSLKRKGVRSLNFRDRWGFVILVLINFFFGISFHFFFLLAIIVWQEGEKLIDYSSTRPLVGEDFRFLSLPPHCAIFRML